MKKYREGECRKMISNVKIYGLEDSIRASKFPMSVDVDTCTYDVTDRVEQLGKCGTGTGHCNFLLGIVVQFDLAFTVKAWTEMERYHFADIVSSQSTMHRISKMDFDKCFCDYVTPQTRIEMDRLKSQYNENPSPDNYLRLLYNCPTGLILTARMTTNYLQLKTIYHQRKAHRLPEWRAFCEWCETLPHAEWIIE